MSKHSNVNAIEFSSGGLRLLDQRVLPLRVEYVDCRTVEEVAGAIQSMVVRGAPAIGITAAYGLYLAGQRALDAGEVDPHRVVSLLAEAGRRLKATRPTAVNLSWAVERLMARARSLADKGFGVADLVRALSEEAQLIHREDVEMNHRIGSYGASLINDGDTVLTHCNAGALATGGYGTALGVIRAAHEQGKGIRVLVDETRPFLQGARLTAWELVQEDIPATLITDNMAGYFMMRGEVNLVVVGADRICSNGDVANKIGTYSLAVLSKEHGIPFYVAAPWSTVDLSLESGDEIVIEERDPGEVLGWGDLRWAPDRVGVANPAFDITPARYISGIITDRGIAYQPLAVSLKKLAEGGGQCSTSG